MNHEISAGGTDLRDPESCLELARSLTKDYPGLQSANGSNARIGN
jgi:hypothetical protein